MYILSIETSCDETAFALAKAKNNEFKLISNQVLSQIKIHEKFGGVVPNLSAREHLKNFIPLLDETFKNTKISLKDVDCYTITNGPGLIPALLIGVSIAKTLAFFHKKPLIPIHHIEGHIYSAWFSKDHQLKKNIQFPALALIVSGGHTQLIYLKNHLNYEIIGSSLDDAVGEAFDKVAKMLNLGYPGGPIISKLAQNGDPAAFDFPRPMIKSPNFDFSFSGIKTAVLYKINAQREKTPKLSQAFKQDICASFQKAAIDTLIFKTKKTLKTLSRDNAIKSLILGGGVSANPLLRHAFQNLEFGNLKTYIPSLTYCGDNAAMQLPVALQKIQKNGLNFYKNGHKTVNAVADLSLPK